MKMSLSKQVISILLLTLILIGSSLGCHSLNARERPLLRDLLRERSQDRQPSPQQAERMEARQLVSQNLERKYYLYTPTSYDPNNPTPLVLGFHGGRTTPRNFARVTKFNQLADQAGFIIAYPEGIGRQWNDGRDTKGLPPQNDVAFVANVIKDIKQIRNIDSRRVYATGISNGGFFTQRLACELSDQIAAFASVAATLPLTLQTTCAPRTPLPILMINSPDDTIVPWRGGRMTKGEGGHILSVPDTIKFWQDKNNCSPSPQTENVGTNIPDKTQVQVTRYASCRRGAEVVLATINRGGHTWPDGVEQPEWLVGRTTHKINGTQFVWNFLKRYSLP